MFPVNARWNELVRRRFFAAGFFAIFTFLFISLCLLPIAGFLGQVCVLQRPAEQTAGLCVLCY